MLLYDNLGDSTDDEHFTNAMLAYPESGQMHVVVPEIIRNAYKEAHRIKNIAPNAFAVQIRRALEAICIDQGETNGNLVSKLKRLSEKEKIPPVLTDAGDILRLLGNVGAHGLSDSVQPLQAFALDEFFRVIIEYLYIAPSKIEEFKKSMEQSKNVKA